MKFLIPLILAAYLMVGAVDAPAFTVVPRDFNHLVEHAETIFKGTVTAKRSSWVGEAKTRHIATFVTFQVHETYKGSPATEQTLEFVGGTVGDERMEVSDMPQFEVGQTAVLFVVGNGTRICPLVGVAQGRFHVQKDASNGSERVLTDDLTPLVKTAELGRVDADGIPSTKHHVAETAQAMTAENFKSEILAAVKTHSH